MLDCRSSLVPQESLTTAANKPQTIDGGDACVDLNQNTNIYNDISKHWITNHSPTQPSPQVASDTPREIYNEFMSVGIHALINVHEYHCIAIRMRCWLVDDCFSILCCSVGNIYARLA